MRNEIRFAQRLCERTARLYRRLHTSTVFFGIVGGSAAVSTLTAWVPPWLPPAGAIMLALMGAVALSVRPAERAAQNEADVRKYARLLADAGKLNDADLAAALAEARLTDVAEIEPLRDVAYNDVVREVGRPDLVAPLRPQQQLLAALA